MADAQPAMHHLVALGNLINEAALNDAIQQRLDQLEQRSEARIERVEARIERLAARVGRIEQRLVARIDQTEQRLVARIDHTEQRLLRCTNRLAARTDYIITRMNRSDSLVPVRFTNSVVIGSTPVRYPAGTPPEVLDTLPATKRAASSMTGENARLALIRLGETPVPGGNAEQLKTQFYDFIGLII